VLLVGVLSGITVGGGVGVFAASSTKTVTVCVDKKDNHMNYSKDSKCKSHQYKVVLNQKGVAGAKGAVGAAGAKGDTGAAGAKGDTGAAGAAGAKGDTGAAGAAGAKGDAGVAGTNGTNGTNGTDGAAGTNGTNGTNGSGAITQQSVCDGTDLDTTANELCKIGMTGPAGGHIFFVDYNDEHTGFDYLEAAPSTCEGTSKTWSSDTTNLKTALSGWALRAMRAVGSGQANTTAMMTSSGSYVADTSGAAFHSDSLTCGGESDWFLGSLDEMKLMYDNLQGIGGFASSGYWSSSENAADAAWLQSFVTGSLNSSYKSSTSYVRPVRAF
jgi:hypothetical protein